MKNIDISIVTVGMNHLSYIKEMYKSLYYNIPSGLNIEMIYVDNCSTDGSVDYLQINYPDIRIIQNTKHKGFGENNNAGVAIATGRIIGIVNPDIQFVDDSLLKIVDCFNSIEKDIIIVPKLANPDGTHQYSARTFATWRSMIGRILNGGNDNLTDRWTSKYLCKDMNIDNIQAVDWAIGAAMFIKRETYLKLGGFDERFFLYLEDEDLCLRAWEGGIPVVYFPKAKLIHNHLRGSRNIGKKTLQHLRSFLLFFRLHGINVCNEARRELENLNEDFIEYIWEEGDQRMQRQL